MSEVKTPTPAAVATAPVVLTSEKLETLKQAVKEAQKAYAADCENEELFAALVNARKAVQSEEAVLKAQQREQELQEARIKRLQPLNQWEEALREELNAFHTKYKVKNPTISMEEMNELTAKTKAAKDAASNSVLGTAARVQTPKTADGGEPKAGSKSATIREFYIANRATLSKSEIEKQLREQGFNDGTINNAINDYLIEIGERAPRPKA